MYFTFDDIIQMYFTFVDFIDVKKTETYNLHKPNQDPQKLCFTAQCKANKEMPSEKVINISFILQDKFPRTVSLTCSVPVSVQRVPNTATKCCNDWSVG